MAIKGMIEKARREKEKRERAKNVKKVGTGLALGAALGSLAGLLFAPKSGSETRKDIANKTTDTVKTVKTTLKDSVDNAKEKSAVLKDNLKGKMENIKNEEIIEGEEDDIVEKDK
ncbi:YtxH domain-containing protein [Clostridiisalibacter paucivorans]|uniref:YtxH domain-containing protein n=1 Tax=Clostridiisalibacter paucivorans TaxID=408753 RepID=UPI00068707B6|nr:YtxH domain-containing protein [Clostridiisalibacter paucivorans]